LICFKKPTAKWGNEEHLIIVSLGWVEGVGGFEEKKTPPKKKKQEELSERKKCGFMIKKKRVALCEK